MAKIAIIDDAIHDGLLKKKVLSRYRYSEGKFYRGIASANPHYTHGTIVAKMLENYATDYQIVSIQLLEDWFVQRKCSTSLLIKALEFCTQINIDVVHISLGTTRLSESQKMSEHIYRLTQSGIPIIAACSNDFYRTIPAAFPNVFGVISDKLDLLREGEFAEVYDQYLGTNFIANNQNYFPNIMSFSKSNSLAATIVTAHVNHILNKGIDRSIPEIYCSLQKESRKMPNTMLPPKTILVNRESIPIVYLIDVFSRDMYKQTALLDEFCAQGYEAVGMTCISGTDDVRMIHYSEAQGLDLQLVQKHLIACTQSDLLIAFLNSEIVHFPLSQNIQNEGVLCISRKELSQVSVEDVESVYSRLIELLK